MEEKTIDEKALRKENNQLLGLVCTEYETKSELDLNKQKEISSQDTALKFNTNLIKANENLSENILFLKKKDEQLATMAEHEKSRQKKDQMFQTEICEMQILQKKKKIVVIRKANKRGRNKIG